jgi:hypothetical protein
VRMCVKSSNTIARFVRLAAARAFAEMDELYA